MQVIALCGMVACALAATASCSLDEGGGAAQDVAGLGGSDSGAGAGGAGTGGCSGATCSGGADAGSAGSDGGEPCDGQCVDTNASCETGTCECGPGYLDTDTGDPKSAACTSTATITSLKLLLAVDHSRLGNLTIKLQSPAGSVLTLMSRPGFTEAADDGSASGQTWPPFNYGPSGDQSDLVASHPISFWDGAPIDAENMGYNQDGGGLAVCREGNTEAGVPAGPECDYHPSPQFAGGPTSLAAAFGDQLTTGKWSLCIGDSDPTATGKLQSWALEFTTLGGSFAQVAQALDLAVPDDGYDGTPTSMLCHEIDAP